MEKKEVELTLFVRFYQPRLIKWFGKIDTTDAVILTYIERFNEAETVLRYPKDDTYIWIHLPTLLLCLPILNMKYDALRKRITKLERIGILKRKWEYNPISGQRMLFLKVTIEDD